MIIPLHSILFLVALSNTFSILTPLFWHPFVQACQISLSLWYAKWVSNFQSPFICPLLHIFETCSSVPPLHVDDNGSPQHPIPYISQHLCHFCILPSSLSFHSFAQAVAFAFHRPCECQICWACPPHYASK